MKTRDVTRVVVPAVVVGGIVFAAERISVHWTAATDVRIAALVALAAAVVAAGLGWRFRVQAAQSANSSGEDAPGTPRRPTDAACSAAWRCDADGRVTHIGSALASAFGYAPREIEGKPLVDLVHAGEATRVRALLSSGRDWSDVTVRCCTRSGLPVWLRTSGVVRGTSGGFAGRAEIIDYHPTTNADQREARIAVMAAITTGAIVPALQPIVSLESGRLVGAELLSRFEVPGSNRTVEGWFVDASRSGLGIELDLHTAERGLRAAQQLPAHIYVSVNLSPETLMWPGVVDFLARAELEPSRLLIEITEREPVSDYAAFGAALRPLRARGIRFAVDDAGSGYAGLRHILRLAPEVIKLDRSMVSNINGGPSRRAMASAIARFADDVGAGVVAEGIEEPDELSTLRRLGITVGQGFLFAKPSCEPADWAAWAADVPPWSNVLHPAFLPHPPRGDLSHVN